MIVPVSDPQLVFRPLLIAGKILPLRASKSISRGQGRRNGSEPGAQAESLQCISARIVSVPCIAGGPFPGTAPAAPRGGGPCVANGRLRHMLIGLRPRLEDRQLPVAGPAAGRLREGARSILR